jgi:hypothetical protein
MRAPLLLCIVGVCSLAWAGLHSVNEQSYPPFPQGAWAQSANLGAKPGYLLDLAVQGGRTRLLSAAEIDNYSENKHLLSEDDWLLLLLDESGANIGARRIANPDRYSPIVSPDQWLPFSAKIPSIAGLKTAVIYNQSLAEQIRIPIDASFREAAAANRREFLAQDRETRRQVEEERSSSRQRAPAGIRAPGASALQFEALPEELQRKMREEIALEFEQIGQSGPSEAKDRSRLSSEIAQAAVTPKIVSGKVVGDNGAAIYRASVLLRQLTSTTTGAPSWSAYTDSQGKFTFSVPGNLEPESFLLAAYASGYLLQSAGLEISQNITYDIQLIRGNTLSGTVRDSTGSAIKGARVRAFREGNFINSGLTDTDGTYEFDLSAGMYEIETIPPAGSTLAPSVAQNVSMSEARTYDPVLAPAAGILSLKLYYSSQALYTRYASKSLVRFELYQSGLTAYAGSGVSGSAGFDASSGKYYRTYSLYVNDGLYSMKAFIAGCRPIPFAEFPVSGQTSLNLDVPEPFLWTGVLRGANRAPLANLSIQSYTDLAREYESSSTNASGQFSILLTPNGFVKFYTDASSTNILHVERIGEVNGNRDEDVVLDSFPSFEDSGSPLTQIYGVPDRSARWNIVMIGDGYTGVTETYTDTNKNGKWDGVIYYDLNKDNVWNTGEPYQRYGNASAPVTGKNPNLTNEPFIDTNGDGIPNLRDQVLFDQNTLDTARSLFGQDMWQLHRDAFNIYRIRLVSRQAGHKVLDKDGKVVINRDTALGTSLGTPDRGYLFSANYSLVSQYINQYVPECDTRIVVVNQPVRMGRVNSYMFQYGGEISTLCNDYVVAHEMGHNVGLLSDEYSEYQETYRGAESAARNITSLSDPRSIPWRTLIPAGKEIPSVAGSSGVGLYEGGAYYTGGRYRPTEYCMMVSGNRYCPVCTKEIEVRLNEITGVVPIARPVTPVSEVSGLFPAFQWEAVTGVSHSMLEVEKVDSGELVASYDLYGTTFTLPFALADRTDYRWRVKPGSRGSWGDWSSWINFRPLKTNPGFSGIFAQMAAGGMYRTEFVEVNTTATAADVVVSLSQWDGFPYAYLSGEEEGLLHLNVGPMGAAHLEISLAGDTVSGYARLLSDIPIDGLALFKTLKDNLILSEAGVSLSKPSRNFSVFVDNANQAASGYAVVNPGASLATMTMTLRDQQGNIRDTASITLPPGHHIAEYASQRFPAGAADGFEGTIDIASDQMLAAIALRYDNVNLEPLSQVFSTLPVLVDEAATTLYFPQVADGGGYRTHFILLNPQDTSEATARLEFYGEDGTPLSLPIGGKLRTSFDLTLNAKGVADVLTDGTANQVRVGWVKVTSPVPIFGSAIFQTRTESRILSEAGVPSSQLMRHFVSYVQSLGSTETGIAICNPNHEDAVLSLNLRRTSGEIATSLNLVLPAGTHVARFFTEWFPRGFAEFEGTLEVVSAIPVSAVSVRYENPNLTVFAAIPVLPIGSK